MISADSGIPLASSKRATAVARSNDKDVVGLSRSGVLEAYPLITAVTPGSRSFGSSCLSERTAAGSSA